MARGRLPAHKYDMKHPSDDREFGRHAGRALHAEPPTPSLQPLPRNDCRPGILDAIARVTDVPNNFPAIRPAGGVSNSGLKVDSVFLASFGRPERLNTCSCERIVGTVHVPGCPPGQRGDVNDKPR